jgi:hypothetical protein
MATLVYRQTPRYAREAAPFRRRDTFSRSEHGNWERACGGNTTTTIAMVVGAWGE